MVKPQKKRKARRKAPQGSPHGGVSKSRNRAVDAESRQLSLRGMGKTRMPTGSGLSRCSEVYAKALSNPFGDFDELPCVPAVPAVQSYRYRALTRTVFVTSSTTGVGFVAWVARNPASDLNTLAVTQASFTGTTIAMSGVGVGATPKSGQQFANAAYNLAGGYRARLVASGARVRCISSEMNTAGQVVFARAGSQSSLTGAGFTTLTGQLTNRWDTAVHLLHEWSVWNWFPQDDADDTFSDAATDWSTASNLTPTMAIMCTGAPASPNNDSFEVEICEFWEVINTGQGAALPALQRSHVDPVGMARVLEGVAVPPVDLRLEPTVRHVANQIIDGMAHSDSASKTVEDLLGIAGLAIPAVGKLVSSLSTALLQ